MSDLAREAATRNVEIAVQQVANLVLHVSALADRVEAKPLSDDLDEARERRERVKVLRDAARAGQEAIQRATADLMGPPVKRSRSPQALGGAEVGADSQRRG